MTKSEMFAYMYGRLDQLCKVTLPQSELREQLGSIRAEMEELLNERTADPEQRALESYKASLRLETRNRAIEEAFEECSDRNEEAAIKDLAAALGKTEKTVRRMVKEHGGFWIRDGKVGAFDEL